MTVLTRLECETGISSSFSPTQTLYSPQRMLQEIIFFWDTFPASLESHARAVYPAECYTQPVASRRELWL